MPVCLGYINYKVRPGKAEGYAAAKAAFDGVEWKDGNTGAGTGATVGKGTAGSLFYEGRFGFLWHLRWETCMWARLWR